MTEIKKNKQQQNTEIKTEIDKIIEKHNTQGNNPNNYRIVHPVKTSNPLSAFRVQYQYRWWQLRKYIFWFRNKYRRSSMVLVTFELKNGDHRQFTVTESEGGFKYRGKQYIFDEEVKYYNMDADLWCYDFHENISLPIRRIFPVSDLIEGINQSEDRDIVFMTNPSLLKDFTYSHIGSDLLKTEASIDWLKRLFWLSIIIMALVIGMILLYMYREGMLSGFAN